MSAPPSIELTFRFVGEEVAPDRITSELGIQPAVTHRKGDPVPEQPSRARPTGIWRFDTALDQSASLEEHLSAMLDILEPIRDRIHKLAAPGCHPELMIGFFLNGDSGYVGLDAEHLARLGTLGVNLAIHLYEDAAS